MNPSKKIDCLIAEYEMLRETISQRSLANLTLGSILIPSTLVITAIAIEFRESLDSILPLGIKAAGFLPLFSCLLLLTAQIYSYRTGKIARVCYERMYEIESTLELKGYKYIYSIIKNAWYHKIWAFMRTVLFLIGFISFIVVSVMLFL